jgi:hypothetical protein
VILLIGIGVALIGLLVLAAMSAGRDNATRAAHRARSGYAPEWLRENNRSVKALFSYHG